MDEKTGVAETGYDAFITDPGDNPRRIQAGIEEFSIERPWPLDYKVGYKSIVYGATPVVSGVFYEAARKVESRLRDVGADGVEIRPSAPR